MASVSELAHAASPDHGASGLTSLTALLNLAADERAPVRHASLAALGACFRERFSRGLRIGGGQAGKAREGEDMDRLHTFIVQCYDAFTTALAGSTSDEPAAAQLLMDCAESESLSSAPRHLSRFTLGKVAKALVSGEATSEDFIAQLRNHLRLHVDVRLAMYQLLAEECKAAQELDEDTVRRVYAVTAGLPWGGSRYLLKGTPEVEEKDLVKPFEKFWKSLLVHRLPEDLYKAVLTSLASELLPRMRRPLELMEFLSASYSAGGVLSVLALDGLFVMITKYGLEYPSFYEKTYALLDETVLLAKHRARFLKLLGVVLHSAYLPNYLVAAFAKRLARLALTATPSGALACMGLLHNLLVRHPAAQDLVHRTADDAASAITEDPYDMAEQDPQKSRALESSLWELKTLKKHYELSVRTFAKRFDDDLKGNIDLKKEGVLDITYSTLFDAEMEKNMDRPPPLEIKPRAPLLPVGKPESKADLFSSKRDFSAWFM